MLSTPDFFDPNSHSSELFQMGGTGHLALVAILLGLLAALILFRKRLPALRQSRAFMAGTAAFVLSFEVAAGLFKFIYPCDPAYERLPLQLCATLKIVITILVLLKRYDLVKYVSLWALGAGFVSFANLNLNGGSFENFAFWHYLVGHYYLFALPLFLFLAGEFRYDVGYHARSMLGLFAWSLLLFFVNWIFGSNYMYSGPGNETVVAFVPARWMVWPLNYVSYLLIGLVLMSAVAAILKLAQDRIDGVPREDPAPPGLEPVCSYR
jgi:hypothetical integral membrane protein (TIGR02206 family)